MLVGEREDELLCILSTRESLTAQLEAAQTAFDLKKAQCDSIRTKMLLPPDLKARIVFDNALGELRVAKERIRDARFEIEKLENTQQELDALRNQQLAELDEKFDELLSGVY